MLIGPVLINRRPTLKQSLETLDAMRADMISGKIVAFTAAALNEKDETFVYSSASMPVTRLRMLGCITSIAGSFERHEIQDWPDIDRDPLPDQTS